MRRVTSTLVAVGLLSVSAPSLAAYVTIEAYGGSYNPFSVTFQSADAELTFDEVTTWSGWDDGFGRFLETLTAIPDISSASIAPNPGSFYLTASPSSRPVGCTANYWCFQVGDDTTQRSLQPASGWLYRVSSPSPVPLPAAAWLMLSGLGGLGLLGRRGKRA